MMNVIDEIRRKMIDSTMAPPDLSGYIWPT